MAEAEITINQEAATQGLNNVW